MPTDLIIIQCIKGEEWPVTGFKSFIEVKDDPITEDSITFHCPAGHKFTLKQALSKDIFSEEQAQKILNHARKQKKEYQERDWSICRASDFLPDKELTVFKLPCVRCGKTAQRRLIGASKVLCLECYADWFNYDKNTHNILDRTWGKPYKLLWEILFDRFLKNMPVLEVSKAEALLKECRKKARRIPSKRSQ